VMSLCFHLDLVCDQRDFIKTRIAISISCLVKSFVFLNLFPSPKLAILILSGAKRILPEVYDKLVRR
jgi:hypothetical protein